MAEEKGMEYSKKINIRKIFKGIFRVILVIIIISIFIILSTASLSLVLYNDASDAESSKEERDDLKKWIEED